MLLSAVKAVYYGNLEIDYCTDYRDARMTLQEIARRAKVSVATVSRTINHMPGVSPSVSRRIQRVIEEVGYYPNTHARALVSGRSRILGLLVSEIPDPFSPETVQTFEDLGVEHNYQILLSSIGHHPGRLEMAARRMIELRVDGVAILTFAREDPLIDVFTRRNVPAVVVDIESPGPLIKTVRTDYRHGIRLAVQHLAALGHVRIAFISGPADLRTAMARKVAFQECMKEIGLEISPKLLIEGDHTAEAGMRAVSTLTASPERPSAVVCSNDMTAIGVIREAFELGLDIPGDLSVIGFDDIAFAQFTTPPLTTVRMPQIEIAKLAFGALLDSVEPQRKGTSREVYTTKTDLVLRRSTAIARDRIIETTIV
ncbi:MAG TPA: LacI family DNA-binding transcriptional regulator [Candidatus Acidoferrum sp.]|nr:LacI family DNA-binding transcriptional regulator [Candidatus Acidoferrum sp.]